MVTLKGSYYFFLLFWALWVFAISRAAGEKTACSREPRVRIQHAAEDSACFLQDALAGELQAPDSIKKQNYTPEIKIL